MSARLMPITLAVVCAHGLALWALQLGWPRQVKDPPPSLFVRVMPAQTGEPAQQAQPQVQAMLAQPVSAVPSKSPPTHASRPSVPQETSKPVVPQAEKMAPPTQFHAAPFAELARSESGEPSKTPFAPNAPAAETPRSAATGGPALVSLEPPSSSAAFLNNPPPPYPPLSKRLGEQGKVVVRALIEPNGTASQALIETSSGYERLDKMAMQSVLQWRYKPGRRAGEAEAMWFNIPISFALE